VKATLILTSLVYSDFWSILYECLHLLAIGQIPCEGVPYHITVKLML